MKKYTYTEVENMVNEYTAKGSRTQFGHCLVAVVSLKERAVKASGRSILLGHVAKVTMVSNIRFATYTSKVASAMGLSITPAPLKGMTWVEYPYIKKANKSGYRYVNIYYCEGDEKLGFATKWLWDGKEATPAQVAEIKSYLYKTNDDKEVKACMYQIDAVYPWDGIFYMADNKADAESIYNAIGK